MSFLSDIVKYKSYASNVLGISGLTTLQGDRPGFPFKLGASATMANPGIGWMRLGNIGSVDSGDLTTFAINVTTLSPSIDLSTVINAAKNGTIIRINPRANTGVDYCFMRVLGKTSMEAGTWYQFDVQIIFATPGLPTSLTTGLPSYIVDFQYDEGIRTDANGGLTDENGVDISGIDKGTYADMVALAPSANDGNYFHVTDYGVNGKPMRYQASAAQNEWIPDGDQAVSDKIHRLYLVFPETNASAVVDNGAGKCRVTITGHLLTALVCVPAGVDGIDVVKLPVTAGTNWTAGQYNILAVPDANTVDIDYPYTAGLGVPTIPPKGNNVIIDSFTVALPPLGKRTEVRVWCRSLFTAAAISRQVKMYLDGTRFGQAIFNSTGNKMAVINQGFENTGSVSAQRCIFHLNMLDDSAQTGNAPLDLAINTSTSKNITFDLQSTNSNLVIGVDRLRVWIRGV